MRADSHPELLPTHPLDGRFVPRVCVAREEVLGPGCRLDNLYVSPAGYVTLVETKLWKNPESRREVVAQIIEYARLLTTWRYADLDRVCRRYTRQHAGGERGLLQWISEQTGGDGQDGPGLDEQAFVETVNESLARGEVKLLVCGEGIQSGVEELAEFLSSAPHLRFNLSLVELACYRQAGAADDAITIVPRLVMRTREVERAVVTVRVDSSSAAVQVGVATASAVGAKSSTTAAPLEQEDFFAKLAKNVSAEHVAKLRGILDAAHAELGLEPELGGKYYMLKLRNVTGTGPSRAVLGFNHDGTVYAGGDVAKFLAQSGRNDAPAIELMKRLASAVPSFKFKETPGPGGFGFPTAPLAEVLGSWPAVRAAIETFVATIDEGT